MRGVYALYNKNSASRYTENELGCIDEDGKMTVMPVSINTLNTTTGKCWSATTHQENANTNTPQENSTEATRHLGSRESDCLSHTDHGWAWIVLVGSCINAFVLGNAGSCFSVLIVEFVSVFTEKKSEIALVGSLQYGVTLISGSVFSRLCEESSYRLVIMAGGAFATCGMTLSYVSNNLTALIGAYGVLTGGMYLQTVAASALLRDIPKTAKEALKKLRSKGWFMMPATDMMKFGLHCWSNLAYGFGMSIVMTFCVLYGTRQGMSLALAALMLTMLNISNVLSRLLVAAVGDRRWFPRQLVFGAATLAGGIISLMFLLAGELWVFALCCVMYGTSYGAKLSIQASILVDLFGIHNIPMVESVYYLFNGVGGLIGPMVADFLLFCFA
ncbi:PREDICTED: monocarboxylate transporter 13-like [Priapulus caudatus]|uniref:Monocarboxylate transporter 13-like n=1 Tax=Priapulus caudatus TaxID=37621 RepID=A0ABM1ELQ2_PRICU|nr:PREDICTED: monocarboxylate transporter 13-like [Priapulus caudatus]